MRKAILLPLVCLLFTISILAQTKSQKFLNISYESGPMLSNGTEWGDNIKDLVNYKALDLQMGWRSQSNTHFDYLYRYPVFGIGFNSTLTYTSEVGRPMAVYGWMDIPFSLPRVDRKLSFGYYTQMGIGFNLTPYDPDINPENQYIGSNINAYVNLGFYSKYQINERIGLRAGLGLKHYSNGATKKPNAGINLFPLNVAVNVGLGGLSSFDYTKPDISEKKLRSFVNFALYTGMRNYEIGDPSYFRGGLGINYLIEPSYKYRLGLGLDFFWAQGMELRFPGESFSFRDQTSIAVVGSWEWQLTSRLFVPIGLGVYLYRNELNQEFTWFYERIGVRYRFGSDFSAGMSIKAHKAKADFFEFTLGYTIPRK
ncbi:acyloxyacyl hydrolase [Algoriphagus confluentis]|uniref:Lipid A 3-O-deacylase PagL n=1 Tax=Algoriphagus confluentis TaxID=1697556 RepID=A0ABQ6PKJ9_9BACT|nr:hypothetical protein Aconfl_11170 [Algoriphagus confluentis]